MLVRAPASCAPATAAVPTPPQPSTATDSPRRTAAVLSTAPIPDITPHPSRPMAAYCSGAGTRVVSTVSGSLFAVTTTALSSCMGDATSADDVPVPVQGTGTRSRDRVPVHGQHLEVATAPCRAGRAPFVESRAAEPSRAGVGAAGAPAARSLQTQEAAEEPPVRAGVPVLPSSPDPSPDEPSPEE